MKTSTCLCGETLYFENTTCSACGRMVGRCDVCNQLAAVNFDTGTLSCGACESKLSECVNRSSFGVCNGMVNASVGGLCGRCSVTTLVPDANDPENVRRWAVLESAKCRLLDDLDTIGLDAGWREGDPPLRFRFAADDGEKKTLTGHADGVITINIAEADPVHREIARQEFGEPQRTVIGHLRHEFGHYLQLRLFGNQPSGEVADLFGDPARVAYSEALDRYYQSGPPSDWRERHISAYASAHPWEDFAETASFYLDMRAVLETLARHQAIVTKRPESFDDAIRSYQAACLTLNEVNRTMGLSDLMPYVVPPPVVEKLRLIDAGIRVALDAKLAGRAA